MRPYFPIVSTSLLQYNSVLSYPRIKISYMVQCLIFLCSVFFVKNVWPGEKVFQRAHPDHTAIITNVPKLLKVDFSSLRIPRYDYVVQA